MGWGRGRCQRAIGVNVEGIRMGFSEGRGTIRAERCDTEFFGATAGL